MICHSILFIICGLLNFVKEFVADHKSVQYIADEIEKLKVAFFFNENDNILIS